MVDQSVDKVNAPQNQHFIFSILLALSFIVNIVLAVFLIYTVRFQQIPQQTIIPSPTSIQPTQADRQTNQFTIPASWKTYTSSTVGITFRYPPDYTVEEAEGAYGGGIDNIILQSTSSAKLGKSSQTATNDWLTVEIHITSSPDSNDTLKKFVEETNNSRNTPLNIGFQVLKSTSYSIGGVPAEYQQWKDNQGNDGETILFIRNNKRYDMLKFPADTSQQDTFNKIISSIQYL